MEQLSLFMKMLSKLRNNMLNRLLRLKIDGKKRELRWMKKDREKENKLKSYKMQKDRQKESIRQRKSSWRERERRKKGKRIS